MKGEGGFIKTILVIVIALVVLGFFGYNLREIINSPAVKDNLLLVWEVAVKIWQTIIVAPLHWLRILIGI